MRTFQFFVLVVMAAMFAVTASAQGQSPSAPETKLNASISPADGLAKAAFDAHGGEKLRSMRTLVVRGSVDVTVSAFNQAFAGGFAMVIAGEKYRLEITNPFQPLRQVSDGVNTTSSIENGFTLPPINRLGLPMLARYGDRGFNVSSLPDGRKLTGFRITAPDGWYTDFVLDEKTKQVKKYESVYEIAGRTVNTIVEIDRTRLVDGVLLPEKFAQRFNLGTITAFADFKAKEILVNSKVSDDVFTLGN